MNRLIVILGPTATGKSELAFRLAQELRSEIISGDSMYVYRGMNIGTAKPSQEERTHIPHHLIDIRNPDETFSVADFQQLAGAAIKEVNLRKNIPILIGGTGLYIQSLLEGYQFNPASAVTPTRSRLQEEIESVDGKASLYKRLTEWDPLTAARLHPNDTRRVVRALELLENNQSAPSRAKQSSSPHLLFDCIVYGLTMDRNLLYQRIDARVDTMMAAGLLDEVDQLLTLGLSEKSSAFQAIGYKELVAFRTGQISLDMAIQQIKQSSRRFSKRQFTWFRRMPYIQWLEVDAAQGVAPLVGHIQREVAEKFPIG